MTIKEFAKAAFCRVQWAAWNCTPLYMSATPAGLIDNNCNVRVAYDEFDKIEVVGFSVLLDGTLYAIVDLH